MNITPFQKSNEEFKPYFNFIQPTLERTKVRSLIIDTNSLGITYTPYQNKLDDDIFKQLNFPHMKKPLYSPSSGSSSTSCSPTTLKPAAAAATTEALVDIIVDNRPKKTIALSPAASFLANFMSPPDNSFVLSNNTQSSPQIKQHMEIDEYLLGESIGFGGFSIVRKAHHQKTETLVAVKIINQHLMTATDKTRLERELTIWKSLHHPRITQLYKIIKTDQTCFILCDYCSEGNLLSFLNSVKKLNEEKAKRIFKEICQGVYYLHVDMKVCHKDLKLENILLNDQGHVKICDFGLAIYQNNHQYADEWVGGSLAYASPEQIKQPHPLTCPKTDIWSLGVILYALVVGALPFTDTYDLRLQQKILDAQYDVPSHLSPQLNQLIRSCLAHDPDKRCTIDQVLNSKWLKEQE
ncbi:hypothetical protein MFLAVUS_009617 [Mucor flavus]|uniref:Protein kinase domain-containing protein n=1 Tax=Mucor flavus TaxID=439312 RepID=A0ABP9ZAE6_9FUNG